RPTMRSSCQHLYELFTRRMAGRRHAEADDLPLQGHAARLAHARAHGLPQPLDVLGRGVAVVDEEVAVHLRHLGAADAKAAAAGLVDQLPGARARRVLEGRAAGALADGL